MNTKELLPLLAAAPLLTATPALGNEMNDTLLAFQKQYEAAMVEFGEWDETEQTLITGTPTDPLSTEVKKEPKITSKKATWKAALGPLGVLLLAPKGGIGIISLLTLLGFLRKRKSKAKTT